MSIHKAFSYQSGQMPNTQGYCFAFSYHTF